MTLGKKSWVSLATTAFVLNGCLSVGPDFETPESEVSAQWLEAEHERLRSDPAETLAWWKQFEDPVLDLLIQQAYARIQRCRSLDLDGN